MANTTEEIKAVVKKWEAEDQQEYSKRVRLFQKMKALRTINESMAEWTRDCRHEWDALNKKESETHKNRIDWNKSNTALASSFVPTLKTFHTHNKIGANASNEMPHWFDTVAISAEASNIAWNGVKAGNCSVDLSTTGGKAVDSLFHMLSQAQKLWKPSPEAVATRVATPFDWNSHDFNLKLEKTQVETKLEMSTVGQVALPREYQNDLQFFIRTSSDTAKVSKSTNEELDAVDDLVEHSDGTGIAKCVSDSISDNMSKISIARPSTPFANPLVSSSSLKNTAASKMGVSNVSGSSWWNSTHWSSK